MKANRQSKILELIADHDVKTQDQLLDELKACGIQATQATISRDIKQLRMVKALSPTGVYRYQSIPSPAGQVFSSRLNSIFAQCVTSAEHVQNMLVIKTMSGLAPAACTALDKMQLPEMIGTLAGDDTCFVLMRDGASAARLCDEIKAQITR